MNHRKIDLLRPVLKILACLSLLFAASLGKPVMAASKFVFSDLRVPAHVKNILGSVDEEVFIDVTVTNVGDAAGECILALMANRTKAAAGRVRLMPGESKVVRMSTRLMGGIQTITNPFTQPDRGIRYLLEVAENKTSVGLGLVYGPSAAILVGAFPDYSLYFYAMDVLAVAFTIWTNL